MSVEPDAIGNRQGSGQFKETLSDDDYDAKVGPKPSEADRIMEEVLDIVVEPAEEFEFEHSVWDASVLLFFTKPGDLKRYWGDTMIVIVSVIMNLYFQIMLVLVIEFDILGEPYSGDTLKTMTIWRATVGQNVKNADANTLTPLTAMICGSTAWSWEQDQYSTIDAYFNQAIPGIVLSILMISQWVFSCANEFRRCLDFTRALYCLPYIYAGPCMRPIEEDGEPKMEICGIKKFQFFCVVFILLIPRVSILFGLCFMGCQWLAQTVSLSDLFLNTFALGFVLDTDELIFDVMMTKRLSVAIDMIKPIDMGERKSLMGGIAWNDILRILVTSVTIFLVIFLWLSPFVDTVEAARDALCGGNQDFLWHYSTDDTTGPNPLAIIDNPSKIWSTECTGSKLSNFWKEVSEGNPNRGTPVAPNKTTSAQERISIVLGHAYSDKQVDKHVVFKDVLDDLRVVRNAQSAQHVACDRAKPWSGISTCTKPTPGLQEDAKSCSWSYDSFSCDGLPPGDSSEMLCGCSMRPSSTLQLSPMTPCNDDPTESYTSTMMVYYEATPETNPSLWTGARRLTNIHSNSSLNESQRQSHPAASESIEPTMENGRMSKQVSRKKKSARRSSSRKKAISSLDMALLRNEVKKELRAELLPELRAEVRSEMYQQLYAELHAELFAKLRADIVGDLSARAGSLEGSQNYKRFQ